MLTAKPSNILDNDLYKFTMQQAVLEIFPKAKAEYIFINRGKKKFNNDFLLLLKKSLKDFSQLRLNNHDIEWLKNACSFFKPSYLEYLKNYKFNPEEISVDIQNENLILQIKGDWHKTILWEVPLMSLISEIYFLNFDINWNGQINNTFLEKTKNKVKKLDENKCKYADFGTRRRLSLEVQDKALKVLKEGSGFVGTSNVYFAKKYNLKPIGTCSHEWIQANSVLEGLRNANYFALHNWVRVYNADLGIALTDTYGCNAFFKNFNLRMSKLYDGVRHDSGDPVYFANKTIEHYKKLNIDPKEKTIVFSDSLTTDKAIALKTLFKDKIKMSFGIGTHFTNDFDNVTPLNMVIKLKSINNIPTVKLSDSPGKETGDEEAIKVAKWTFFNTPLCQK